MLIAACRAGVRGSTVLAKDPSGSASAAGAGAASNGRPMHICAAVSFSRPWSSIETVSRPATPSITTVATPNALDGTAEGHCCAPERSAVKVCSAHAAVTRSQRAAHSSVRHPAAIFTAAHRRARGLRAVEEEEKLHWLQQQASTTKSLHSSARKRPPESASGSYAITRCGGDVHRQTRAQLNTVELGRCDLALNVASPCVCDSVGRRSVAVAAAAAVYRRRRSTGAAAAPRRCGVPYHRIGGGGSSAVFA